MADLNISMIGRSTPEKHKTWLNQGCDEKNRDFFPDRNCGHARQKLEMRHFHTAKIFFCIDSIIFSASCTIDSIKFLQVGMSSIKPHI